MNECIVLYCIFFFLKDVYMNECIVLYDQACISYNLIKLQAVR